MIKLNNLKNKIVLLPVAASAAIVTATPASAQATGAQAALDSWDPASLVDGPGGKLIAFAIATGVVYVIYSMVKRARS